MLSASFVRCGTGTLAWKIAPLQGGKSEVCSRVVLLYDKLHGVVTESAMSIIEEDLRWWRESRHVSPLLYRGRSPAPSISSYMPSGVHHCGEDCQRMASARDPIDRKSHAQFPVGIIPLFSTIKMAVRCGAGCDAVLLWEPQIPGAAIALRCDLPNQSATRLRRRRMKLPTHGRIFGN